MGITRGHNKSKQGGLVVVLFTFALLLLLGFAALAIDVNHVVLNKSRLQNAVDAAALSAAVVADDKGGTGEIATAALVGLKKYLEQTGNSEFDIIDNSSFGSGSDTTPTFNTQLNSDTLLTIQLSNDPSSFSSGTFSRKTGSDFNDIYVRVKVSNVTLNGFFVNLFDLNKSVSASAVAGPSSSISRQSEACNVVPLAVCAANPDDDQYGGYTPGELQVLKDNDWSNTGMNSGNFGLLNMDGGGAGKDEIAQYLAGGYTECISTSGEVETSKGQGVGKVADGLNVRFGDNGKYAGDPDEYIKEADVDLVNETTDFTYQNYLDDLDNGGIDSQYLPEGGVEGRRVLQVPILDCDAGSLDSNGKIYKMVTVGCFFLSKKAPPSNSNNDPQRVVGEFIEDCLINNGTFGVDPISSGAYKIQLYKDPDSQES
ncbi:pilus assembly protein TadG-related protein [Vibrio breoganii]|uniref:pilus assembly protein TadG-related protein n=1 Tax=Vibrio breoganii TaxID=553239 RepID=UPI000C8188D1|nr:pilus assembly protein TadG-related protein [Vibrio breoganii]PML35732.1 hypothetical protein BCT78_02320 [Vibrio breoganii]